MTTWNEEITDFLDGQLSEEESKAFVQEMKKNPALAEAVALQQSLNAWLAGAGEANQGQADLEAQLLSHRHYFTDEATIASGSTLKMPSKVNRIKLWLTGVGVAACLFLVLNYTGVFSDHLADLPTLQTEQVRGGDGRQQEDAAISAFNQKEYAKSAQLFEALWEQNKEVKRFQYYLGLSYVGQKKWQEAATLLEQLAQGPSLFKDDAAYFAALAYNYLGEKSKSQNLARQVSESSNYYKKANKLLR